MYSNCNRSAPIISSLVYSKHYVFVLVLKFDRNQNLILGVKAS